MKPTILGVLTLSLWASTASAQKAHTSLYTRAADGVVRAAIQIEIDEDWHLYHHELGHPKAVAKPTEITLEGDGIEWTELAWPEPEVLDQSEMGAGVFALGHHGTIHVFAAGRLAAGATGADVGLDVNGLTCLEDGQCVPYSQSVVSKGEGPDAVFADFPADLVPEAWRASAVEDESASEDEPAAAQAPELAPSSTETPRATEPVVGGEATFQLFTRVEEGSDLVRALLVIDVAPEWHIFHEDKGHPDAAAMDTTLDWRGVGITWGEAVWPEPEFLDQSIMGEGVFALVHHGKFAVAITGRLAPGASALDASVGVRGQTCVEDGQCIPIMGLTVHSSGAGADRLWADFPAGARPPGDSGAAAADVEPGAEASDEPSTGTSGEANGLEDSAEGEGEVASGDDDAEDEPVAAASTPTPATDDVADEEITESAVVSRLGRSYEPREDIERGLGMWLLFAFIAGMILNVMPCVLPVVSIKILSFVNQAGESRGRIFALGLMFSLGILVVFLVLGALAAFAGQNWGSQFQSTTFLVVMIAIVFAFSLSLFGLFELGVPSAVGQMAGQQQRREGLLGAFSMGILSTILATPCSGPFLGSTLAWAVTQPSTTVLAIFAMAGVGMAFPYAILTSNPAFLKYVPKPGPWMETFKHLMGFLLLFTVLFLMASVPDDKMIYLLTFLVFVGLGCWVWGHFATFDQKSGRRMATLAWVAIAFAGGGFLSFRTLPSFFAEVERPGGQHLWEPFDLDQLAMYQNSGRNVFVDFTADWCLTCKTNEKVVYEADETVDLFEEKGVAVIKADETNAETAYVQWIKAFRNHLGSQSIPFSAIFPADDPTRPYIFRDLVSPEGFRAALEALPDPR